MAGADEQSRVPPGETKLTSNVRSQATDAALSRQVACTDGLCGNGSEVGTGDTAKGTT